jgi:NAD(P)H-hydrate epimerase
VLPPASNCGGELFVAHIGSPLELIEQQPSRLFLADAEDAQIWLRKTQFSSNSYKNKRGHALLIAGSKNYAGAAVLCGNAAIRSGVGLVTIGAPESVQNVIGARVLPEVMVRALPETAKGSLSEKAFADIGEFWDGIDAVAIGSGISSSDKSTAKLVTKIIENRRVPVVIDADALTLLAPFKLKGPEDPPLILTPHEGEFLRLIGRKEKLDADERVELAREFAQKNRVILVLKGERTLIAAPSGQVVINPTGNSGLGKAGNGDTLTGIIAGFVAQSVQCKTDVFEAVVAAVYIAGLAGDLAENKYGKRVMTASDVRECLAEAFEELET